jgi:hypothetical protein
LKQKEKSLPQEPRECGIKNFIIRPSEIHYLRFIVEAYEGIGVVTTLDPKLGLMQIRMAPGCEELVERILEAEKDQLQMREVTYC